MISLSQPVRTVENGEAVTMKFRVLESVCARQVGRGISANLNSVSKTPECETMRF